MIIGSLLGNINYIDVKRRENAFVLNSNSTVTDSPPLRTVSSMTDNFH
jgi:hypothetical protein